MAGQLLVHFQVSYMTVWGQRLVLLGSDERLGNYDPRQGKSLTCRHQGDELIWETSLPVQLPAQLHYKYAVLDDLGAVHTEERELRDLDSALLGPATSCLIMDKFQENSDPNLLLSRSAFSDVILGQRQRKQGSHIQLAEPCAGSTAVHFHCWTWNLKEDEQVVLLGSASGIGRWQAEHAVPMVETTTPHWDLQMSIPSSEFPVEYKYAVRRRDGSLNMEPGDNRILNLDSGGEFGKAGVPDFILRGDGSVTQSKAWQGAGIAVPVFSLRSHISVGCGEFVDIKALVDFCACTGIRMIQLLPINDTSVYNMWWDSYPYNAISVFALHPIYICLDALSGKTPQDIKDQIVAARSELNLPSVDYEKTLQTKLKIARELFDEKDHVLLKTEEYVDWFAANEQWLQPYAVFCFLRDLFGTTDFTAWGAFSRPTAEMLSRLSDPRQEWHASIRFTYYVQYQLHRQLMAVSNYAKAHRVALKGDLPIGVSKRSVDTWLHPEEFHMEFSTGAPPDYFDANGQNWGFPTYNWQAMQKTGYSWWQARLTNMAQYFHAYRIDHILGFFRIWEIPGSCRTGLLGHFRPSIPASRAHLESQGLWDIDRLCLPWITSSILKDAFGEQASSIASHYLDEHFPDRYIFRDQFNTEEKLARSALTSEAGDWATEELGETEEKLMQLMQNVVLLKDAVADAYTPRIKLMSTSSFQELPRPWQGHLRWLHDDYFYHRHTKLWSAQAGESLGPLMHATPMLVCGEDLGMVPDCVHPVLKALGLLGLRIQRMSAGEEEFGDPSTYPYLTVASPSCHDTSTTRAWYEEDKQRRQRFYTQALKLSKVAPDRCSPDVMSSIFMQHLASPCMWTIFPLQDFMALSLKYGSRPAPEETINDPTNPRHYWRFRMHVYLEDMLEDSEFIQHIQTLLLESGRTSEGDLPC